MALTCCDFAGFEVDTGIAQIVSLEGAANGTAASILADVAPYPSGEDNTLRLVQNSSTSTWEGTSCTAVTEDDVVVGSFYVYFDGGAWPPTNDIPLFRLRTTSGSTHFLINITNNGGNPDIEIYDANAVLRATLTASITSDEFWWRFDYRVKLSNSPNAELELRTVFANTGVTVETSSISGAGPDFYGGSSGAQVYLQGETGVAPPTITYTRFGSYILAQSDTTVALESFYDNYIILGGQTSVTGVTPDCDKDDNAGGDDLDGVNGWEDTADGVVGINNRAYYGQTTENGAVVVDHPADDADVPAIGATRYGGEYLWVWQGQRFGTGNASFLYGKELNAGTFDVDASSETWASGFQNKKIFKAGDTSPLPDVTTNLEHGVMGIYNISTDIDHDTLSVYLMYHMSAFKYPLPPATVREIIRGGTAIVVGRTGRIVI